MPLKAPTNCVDPGPVRRHCQCSGRTRRQPLRMKDIVTAAGYATNSATGPISSVHSLFVHTGPNRYRVLRSLTEADSR